MDKTSLLRAPRAAAVLVLMAFLFAACAPAALILPDTPTPPPTESPIETEPDIPSESEPCAYRWARRPLPELSDSIGETLLASIPDAEFRAEAYGEECVDGAGNIRSFNAMETDFYLVISVDDLEDEEALGTLAALALEKLTAISPETTPGPQEGYIGITFQTEETSRQLWIEASAARALLEEGLRGAALFRALAQPNS